MPNKELNEQVMEQIDRKFYAGNQTIRMLERALGSIADNNELFNKGTSNEMINRGRFNPNYQHNNFNSFFNNNRAVIREPLNYKTPQVFNNWQQNQLNRPNRQPDNNIFNAFNQVMAPNQHYRGVYPRNNQNNNRNYNNNPHFQNNFKRPRPEYVIFKSF